MIFLLFLQDPPQIQTPQGLTVENWIAIAAIIIPTMGAFLWLLITLIYRSGEVLTNLKHINNDVRDIKNDVKPIPVLVDRVNTLWRTQATISRSPMMLNEFGEKILKASKIDELTTKYYDEILEKVKLRKPENAFQAQEFIIEEVGNYKNLDKCKPELEQAAFNSGTDVDTVLLVAAVNIRDKMLYDLKLNRDDIDKFDPSKNKPKGS